MPGHEVRSGKRVAILAGQGALPVRDEVTALADLLGAPVAKALLGKAVLSALGVPDRTEIACFVSDFWGSSSTGPVGSTT